MSGSTCCRITAAVDGAAAGHRRRPCRTGGVPLPGLAGAEMTLHAFARGERTESTWAPLKWPLFLAMPVGLGLTALQYVADLLREAMTGAEKA